MTLQKNDLDAFIQQLTSEPGVYQMLDAEGHVLYVGKALHLKQRVSQYFNASAKGVKTNALVRQITSIQVTVTRSETEALLLESTLIKALRPKYNVLLRDDKSYPYLQLSNHPTSPQLSLVRYKKKPTTGAIFGPYSSATAARQALTLIQKTFKLRDCSDAVFRSRTRPCLQYQMKRCSGPCVGAIAKEAYQQTVSDAKRFLQGKSQTILDALALRMQQAVAALAFEEAARLRDQMQQLRLAQEQQSMITLSGEMDVVVFDVQWIHAGIQWVSIREGVVLQSKRFFPETLTRTLDRDAGEDALWQSIFAAFMGHHYLTTPERIPACIMTDRPVHDKALFEAVLTELRGSPCRLLTHPRGVQKQWLDFAWHNLKVAVSEHESHVQLMQRRYEALAEILACTSPIHRMECYDISHTQGQDTVASCVVFNAYGPDRSHYRRFNIHDITPGDDAAAMKQVLFRRFKRLMPDQKPDVVLIDGGVIQVHAAQAVFDALQLTDIILLGIAKGTTRKAGLEYLVFADGRPQLSLPSDSPALHLLQHIRDEAHRFAITAHRKKRQKTSLRTVFASIPGIGPTRRLALLTRFGGVKAITQATVEELSKVPGISHALAIRIYDYFRTPYHTTQ